MVFCGRAFHVIGDESWPVVAGGVFVVGGSEAHEYREIKDLCFINILFLPESTSGLLSKADALVSGGGWCHSDDGQRRRPASFATLN